MFPAHIAPLHVHPETLLNVLENEKTLYVGRGFPTYSGTGRNSVLVCAQLSTNIQNITDKRRKMGIETVKSCVLGKRNGEKKRLPLRPTKRKEHCFFVSLKVKEEKKITEKKHPQL
jgi:hypothetical protein